MTLRDEINALTPKLRRYMRALAGGAAAPLADEVVQATLMRALGARQIGSAADLAIRLYATATQLHREMAMPGGQARAAGSGRPSLVTSHPKFVGESIGRQTKLSAGLLSLSVEEREALLLVALEGFDHAEAARILRVSRAVFIARLTQARTKLDAHLQTRPPASRSAAPHLRVVK